MSYHQPPASEQNRRTESGTGSSSGQPQRKSQSARKAAIARDFRKRLRGKPTHATPSRAWYKAFASIFLLSFKSVVVILLLIAFIVGGFGGGLLAGYVRTAEPISQFEIASSTESQKTSFIYDVKGNVIAKLVGSENIDSIYKNFGDIKHTYIDEALVSVEDERFYTHNGIDLRRIGSAVLSMLSSGGSASHGGSTITQQTIKLITGQNQNSMERKIQEWIYAIDLEKQLSKDQILNYYINLMPMGNNYIGVQSAAKNYFGKDASELTLAECAFLAGIPRSPTYYNPSTETGRRNALRRMRIVLSMMHEQGRITDAEFEEARNAELIFVEKVADKSTPILSYFSEVAISEVQKALMEQKGLSATAAINLIYSGGVHIYTTLDPDVQKVLDETFSNQDLFQRYPEQHRNEPEKPQGSAVIIDNATGAIVALQGGYGQKIINRGINRAVDAHRRPGSSIKPLISYAPALQTKKYVPTSLVDQTQGNLDPSDPGRLWPRGLYSGNDTIRGVIRKSDNPAAVRVIQDIGYETALNYLKLNGIDRTDEVYPAIALGGFTYGMSSLEMAAAYATFANQGVYREPFSYTHVTDSNGKIILENEVAKTNVFSPETAFMMSDMLRDVITSGTASGNVSSIKGGEIDVAGKTGTTDDALDKWFCGFTPYYSAAVWYGYDNRLKKTQVPSNEEANAMRIWNDFMQQIHEDKEAAHFTRPDSVERISICTITGLIPTEYCPEKRSDWFVVGQNHPETPTKPCYAHIMPPVEDTPKVEWPGEYEAPAE